jgi:hypothetical protein
MAWGAVHESPTEDIVRFHIAIIESFREAQPTYAPAVASNQAVSSDSLMPLLPNRYGEPLTRFGAFRQIKKLVKRASVEQPTPNRRPLLELVGFPAPCRLPSGSNIEDR